jgi:TFIIF-interacting CTD phosphatase-like protein
LAGTDDGKSLMSKPVTDGKDLIDVELISLLKFCNDLYNETKLENPDYEDDLMMKSMELGKKTRSKLLILDMDETMVSARFHNKLPEGFVTDFIIDFHGSNIHVRIRPYLAECLERMAKMFEIVVFTAGV